MRISMRRPRDSNNPAPAGSAAATGLKRHYAETDLCPEVIGTPIRSRAVVQTV